MPGDSTSASNAKSSVRRSRSVTSVGIDAGCDVVVPRHHIGAHRRERARGRQAVAAQPQHGEALAREQVVGKCAHRIFNVARPTSARIIEMIQKRITMVGSAQPFFSK